MINQALALVAIILATILYLVELALGQAVILLEKQEAQPLQELEEDLLVVPLVQALRVLYSHSLK